MEVTEKEVLFNIKQLLNITHSQDDMFLISQIYVGLQRFATYDRFQLRHTQLSIANFQSTLPNDFFRLEEDGLIIGRSGNVGGYYPIILKSTFNYTKNTSNSFTNSGGRTATFVNGYIEFSTNVLEDTCDISYLGLLCDKDGFPLIPESNIDAITHFVCYMYYLRENKPNNIMYEHKKQYEFLSSKAKGNATTLQGDEKRTLGELYRSISLSRRYRY